MFEQFKNRNKDQDDIWVHTQLRKACHDGCLVIPKEITVIPKPENVISVCRNWNLETVVFPQGFREIGTRVFEGSGLTQLNLPDSVTKLGVLAFQECRGLKEVVIGDGVTEIPSGCFLDCLHLRRVVLGKNVRKIAPSAFEGCRSLEEVVHPHPEQFPLALGHTPYWQKNQPPTGQRPQKTEAKSGRTLREQGHPFFDPKRSYVLKWGSDGIVEASAWSRSKGPDEDGFGREEEYDWWLLDGDLNPIPGIEGRKGWSNVDMRNCRKDEWVMRRDRAAEIVAARKKRET